jgi:endonuclease YncB( thermonuclease family)
MGFLRDIGEKVVAFVGLVSLVAGAIVFLVSEDLALSSTTGLAVLTVFTGQPKPAPTLTKSAVVDHVADGDTIAVRIGGREEDIRFIGIDTPEVCFGVECGGPQASASMKRMLEPGDQVSLVRDRTQANRDR